MSMKIEPVRTGEYLVSEANGSRSRDEGILASGKLVAGTVLALNTNGDYVQLDPAATDGTEVAKAILYSSTDATLEPKPIVTHTRACEVSRELLTFPEAATDVQISAALADLEARGVIAR